MPKLPASRMPVPETPASQIPAEFGRIAALMGRPEEVVVLRGGPSPWVLAKSPAAVHEVLIRKEGLYSHPAHPFASLAGSFDGVGAALLQLGTGPAPHDALAAAVDRHLESRPLLRESDDLDLAPPAKVWAAHLLVGMLWQATTPSLSAFVAEIARQERAGPEARGKAVPSRGALLQELFTSSPGLAALPDDDAAARSAVIRTLLNGYNALAVALVWSLVHLGRDGDLRRRLRRQPTELEGFVSEVLRLYPPAWILARRLLQQDTLRGLALPPGTVVQVSPFLTQRDPLYWEEPERLRLDRHLSGDGQTRTRRAGELRYFPFGGGARVCPAARFVPGMLRRLVERILDTWDLELLGTEPPRPVGWISLHPEPGPRFRIRRR